MHIIEIKDRGLLDGFVGAQAHSPFLQSWAWGEFQAAAGAKVFRLGVEEDGKLLAAATLVRKKLFGKYCYLYCPRGPLTKLKVESRKLKDEYSNEESGDRSGLGGENKIQILLFEAIENLARRDRAIFLRFEPHFQLSTFNFQLKKTIDVQPSKTLVLDLARSEDELLADMHQKTRYNIRLAEKKGVTVRLGGSDDFEIFWKIMSETVKRDGFRLHAQQYYRDMFGTAGIRLYLAEYEGEAIAAGVMYFFGDTATYLHGASSDANRNVMAPFLLQWQAIKDAKATGCRYYDFHGIDAGRWPGVTRFKQGFGGSGLDFPGTFDMAYHYPLYVFYKIIRKIRRMV